MAHLGADLEFEARIFCAGCRQMGSLLAYDLEELKRLVDTKEVVLGDQCHRCGGAASEPTPEPAPAAPAAAVELEVESSAEPAPAEPDATTVRRARRAAVTADG